jgi:hypothetical protein
MFGVDLAPPEETWVEDQVGRILRVKSNQVMTAGGFVVDADTSVLEWACTETRQIPAASFTIILQK